MNCKHCDVIRIVNNNEKEYYCKLKSKEISRYECKNCMMKLPDTNQGIKEVFRGFGLDI